VASTPVGRQVDVVIIREGKQQTLQVKLGRLKDDEKQASAKDDENDKGNRAGPGQSVVQRALGMDFASLNEDTRQRYSIGDSAKGVVVTQVDPNSPAADRQIKPGELIVEVNQQKMTRPEDIVKKTTDLKAHGRKAALLLVSTPAGEMRFVALPLD
jgi:serine protease Do